MKKLASRLPIQQMIAQVISTATEKLAEDESAKKKVQKLVDYERQEHGHVPSPSEERAEHEKTASARTGDDYIEKLANAVEFIAGNFDSIEFPHKGVLQKAAEEAGSPQGAGKGPGSLEVSKAIGGEQAYKKDKPKTEDAAASQADKALSGARPGDGKTQLDNDMHDAPGGGDVAPTARYPEKGPLVAGPTVKHASVQALYQAALSQPVNTPTTKTASSPLRQAVLAKLAGEDVMKANISAERSANPLAGMGQLESTDATQASPGQAGDAGSGFGNQARKHIASNQAAIDYTKRDAKGPVKTQLSEVLEEPALSASTDSKLEENLRNTGKAGVKIAAAKSALQKVAAEGCTCQTIDGGCPFCELKEKVAAAAQRKGSTKTANAMMGYGGSGGASGGASMGGGMGGGGMMSMADAGAGADGCTCAGMGECRVCKLKAALAAAKAGGQGLPGQSGGMASGGPAVDKDSNGSAPAGGIY